MKIKWDLPLLDYYLKVILAPSNLNICMKKYYLVDGG